MQAQGGKAEAIAEASANFMRQFRDTDSRELKQLTAGQFMTIWEHYDDDGEFCHVAVCMNMHGLLQKTVHKLWDNVK